VDNVPAALKAWTLSAPGQSGFLDPMQAAKELGVPTRHPEAVQLAHAIAQNDLPYEIQRSAVLEFLGRWLDDDIP